MRQDEALRSLGQNVRILLKNQFHFSGKIVDVTQDTLILLDKFGQNVSLHLNEIMVLTILEK